MKSWMLFGYPKSSNTIGGSTYVEKPIGSTVLSITMISNIVASTSRQKVVSVLIEATVRYSGRRPKNEQKYGGEHKDQTNKTHVKTSTRPIVTGWSRGTL